MFALFFCASREILQQKAAFLKTAAFDRFFSLASRFLPLFVERGIFKYNGEHLSRAIEHKAEAITNTLRQAKQ
jgi:hypothetical protein